MNTFSDELRKAREAKNISLAEISSVTRISLRYLEAIERGTFDVLPQTYVRAFLREYASIVGLSPGEVMKKFDIMVSGKYSTPQESLTGSGYTSSAGVPLIETSIDQPPSDAEVQRHITRRKIIITGVFSTIALFVLIFLFSYTSEEQAVPVAKETPFQDVLKEQEHELRPPPPPVDSVSSAVVKADSIVLHGSTVDSVWVRITADEEPPREMLLGPKMSRTWRAKERITVTLGNAGGIRFTVNGKDIGYLGKRGAVLRNAVITSSGITE